MDHYSPASYSLPVASAASIDPTPRPGTPDSENYRSIQTPRQNPFASPYASQTPSRSTSSAALNQANLQHRYFHSRRIKKGEAERPWTNVNDPREKWVTIIPLIGLAIGLAIAGFLVWDGLRTVINYKYCTVYEDNFSNGFNTKIWTKEAEVGGFGNGQFEETTITEENVFVRDGLLYIKPTLQDAKLIETN